MLFVTMFTYGFFFVRTFQSTGDIVAAHVRDVFIDLLLLLLLLLAVPVGACAPSHRDRVGMADKPQFRDMCSLRSLAIVS